MVSKAYGKNIVLREADLSFPGQCSLIIGKNGSGKTTVLKILAGLARQYQGEDATLSSVSLLLDGNLLFSGKTGKENLSYYLNDQEIPQAVSWSRYFQVDSVLEHKVRTYSQGMKKKLMQAIAFAREKENLLLDEPTNTLDRNALADLKKALKEIKMTKKLIIASHDVFLADASLVDDIYLLKAGRLVKRSLQDYAFQLYRVKTLLPLPSDLVLKEEEGAEIVKIPKEEKKQFFKRIADCMPTELTEVSYFDDMYFTEIYDEKSH